MSLFLLQDEEEAFTKEVLSVKDQAYKIAYSYLRNEQDSIDTVYNAVEKALLNYKKLKDKSFFKTWFIRIIINECKMLLRKRSKVISIADSLYKDELYSHQGKEGEIDLETALNQLNQSDRIFIYMKYYMGYTLSEIANIFKLPEGTIKTKIYSNLKMIKEKIKVKEA